MILNSLSLKNFRNFAKKEIVFSEKSNLIVGPNASGKTNILEAIYLLATGKSFRVKSTESEAISYGEEIARVLGKIEGPAFAKATAGKQEGQGEQEELEIILTTGEVSGEKVAKKKYLVNGVAKRAFDFVGNLKAVYFGPEDLELITDSPSLRRKYLDSVLSQTDKEYARASLSYEKGLRSRNRLLEEMRESGIVDRRRLYFWDQLLIKNGNIITKIRQEYLDFLNSRGEFEGVGKFEVEYNRSTISAERLNQYSQEEIFAGVTLVGPHRDDFFIRIMNYESRIMGGEARNLSVFGSRGEQRLAILWLKLGEMAFIKEKTKSFPVLLLDDIFSELDVGHRQLVLQVIDDQQTIITSTDLGRVEESWLGKIKIIEL